MVCIVVELAGVYAVVEVDPPRILATCQHKEYAEVIAAALEEYDVKIELMDEDGEQPEPIIGVQAAFAPCARCGQMPDAPVHRFGEIGSHAHEIGAGDAPKLPR